MRILTVRDITCLTLVYRDDARQVTSYEVVEGVPAEHPGEPEVSATDTFMTVETASDDDDLVPLHSMLGTRMVLPEPREYTVVVHNLLGPGDLSGIVAECSTVGLQAWVRGDPHRTILIPRLVGASAHVVPGPDPRVELIATAAPDAGAFMGYPTGADDQRAPGDYLLSTEVNELPAIDTHVSIRL